MVLRRIWGLGAAAAALLVGACDDAAVVQNYFVRGEGIDNRLVNATMSGPMLVRIHGNPFKVDQSTLEDAVVDRMGRAIQRRVTRFTVDPAAAPQPDYRVVIAFGLPKGESGKALCGPEGSIPALEPAEGAITLRAAFCHKDTLWSDVGGHMPAAESPEDKTFRTLIRQMTIELFPEDSH